MSTKKLFSMLVYVVIPIVLIVLLFKLNTWTGVLGIVIYLVVIIAANISSIYFIRGKVQYGKGNLDETIKLFEKAVKKRNASAEAIASYGFVLFKAGYVREAEKVLLRAINMSKTNDQKNLAKSNLAIVLWKKGKIDEAIAMLKKVVSEYKTTAVYGSLGYMVIEKGDLDDAMKINLEAYEYNSDDAIILDNLAYLYYLKGDFEKAAELFEKLMEKKPHFPEAYYNYGQYLENAERYEEAMQMYNKALSCPFNYNSTITIEQVREQYNKVKSLTQNS